MAKIKVHAGDFNADLNGEVMFGVITLYEPVVKLLPPKITYMMKDLETIEVASEESVKRIGGTIGWGAAGAVVLGPVGLLAGLLLGGKKKDVTFVAKFKDGRKLLGTTDSKTYTKMMASVF